MRIGSSAGRIDQVALARRGEGGAGWAAALAVEQDRRRAAHGRTCLVAWSCGDEWDEAWRCSQQKSDRAEIAVEARQCSEARSKAVLLIVGRPSSSTAFKSSVRQTVMGISSFRALRK